MTQALPKQITFAEFLEWKPENGRYELRDEIIFEMQPTGEHEEIKGFLTSELAVEFRRLKLPYFIPNQALVKPPQKESAYLPDILILNRSLVTQCYPKSVLFQMAGELRPDLHNHF